MQTVYWGDNLHKLLEPIFWENITNLSAEFAPRVVQLKGTLFWERRQIPFSQELFPL